MRSQEEQLLHAQAEQALRAQAEQVRRRMQSLAADLRVVDDEVESLAPQRMNHELLDQACGSLEKLGELGAASLFWGERIDPVRVAEQLRGVRSRVSAFQAQLGKLDGRRQAILARISREEENLEILGEDLYYIREAEERRKLEWVVEREVGPLPVHVQVMAWARGGEDDSRFRKVLGSSLLASLLLALVLPMINLPLPRRLQPEDVPKRLVQLIRQEQAKLLRPKAVATAPLDQQKPAEPKPSEQRDQPPSTATAVAAVQPQPYMGAPQPDKPPGPSGPGDDQLPPGTPGNGVEPQPPLRPGKPGILAFKDQFASLTQDKDAPRLGASARFSNTSEASRASSTSRSMLTTNAPGSSGGINIASLSRSLGGSGGGGAGAVRGDGGGGGRPGGSGGNGGGGGGGDGAGGGGMGAPGRATSPIASIGGDDRPKARGGPANSRTDEEIQIVFDRHKASFYRLYSRELRNNPTLKGQMVLRLTIEPDGSVSMCVLQSTDMNAPDLASQVVNRVKTINFGAKDVQALTIVYPIDFLPAA